MQYCCHQFEYTCQQAGKRGFAIIVDASGDKVAFFLQCRTVNLGDEDKLSGQVFAVITSQTGILACPWWGADLNKFYGKYAAQMDRSDLSLSCYDSPSESGDPKTLGGE